jgi:hypothetical protein
MLKAPVPSISEVLKAALSTVSTWMGDRYKRVNPRKDWLALLLARCMLYRIVRNGSNA